MNIKKACNPPDDPARLDLINAVEAFVAQGGIIAVIDDDERTETSGPLLNRETTLDSNAEKLAKLELLKDLVAKGAGVSTLQYSLRMNKKAIRQMAVENGIKLNFSRPIRLTQKEKRYDTTDIDDVVAGHAMHYSSLGYTAPEIAQVLGLSLREVWNIGKAYRFEFNQRSGLVSHDPDR
ncbi:hypothetical protein N015_20465 [Pseudomonas asturiensis]|uniref:Uncharacterized protein n=1 Tax=Pseudomonas asturiensis TaxID=1190415 RepID=A0ABX6HGD4_9PSED|nr:hypothetical protein [Pseudomonas asturiensis]QHF04650.1 hypothetical protein N015_20465 [Pseudomonas asturiensis]